MLMKAMIFLSEYIDSRSPMKLIRFRLSHSTGLHQSSMENLQCLMLCDTRWLKFRLVNRMVTRSWELGIFTESTTPRMFKIEIGEFAVFHPSETLDQNQLLEVILQN